MNVRDIASLIVSILAASIAAYAAFYTRHAMRSQRTAEMWSANHEFLARLYALLLRNPELLELHGFTCDDLAQDGVSLAEFVYIYLHMDAGSALYHIGAVKKATLTEVRKQFIRDRKVRVVWQNYLRGRFFSSSHPYSRAVEVYIAEVEASTAE